MRLRPPGSDWLYLRLHCPAILQDDLIVDRLAPFADFARSSSLADDWFFIRYADPDPHLRLRLHGRPDVLREKLLPQACAWAERLVRDGMCGRFAIDTYEREVERYGGPHGVELAERIFGVDSRAVADLLRLERDLPWLDRMALAVAGVDGLIAGLGLDRAQRLAWYRSHVRLTREDGRDHRVYGPRLRRLLATAADAGPGADALADVLAARRRDLTSLAPSPPPAALIASFAHMSCNRLLGTDGAREERALALARRAVESLERAPLA